MISIITPTRGRPELAKRMYESALSTAKQPENLQILFYLNHDDEKLEHYKSLISEKNYYIGPDQSTCYSWNLMCEKTTNDIVMLVGDDVQILTNNWDQLIVEEFQKYNDKILMVVPKDGRNKEKLGDEVKLWEDKPLGSPHFALHKNWINTLGYFLPPFFWHWYVDAYTQKVARKLNRCLYLPTVEFKAKKIVDDPTAQKVRGNLNINNRDAYVWNKVKDQHLDTDVKKLQEFIDNFKK